MGKTFIKDNPNPHNDKLKDKQALSSTIDRSTMELTDIEKEKMDAKVEDNSNKTLKPQFKRLLVEKIEASGLSKAESNIVLVRQGLTKVEKDAKDAPLVFSMYRVVEFADDCRDQFKKAGVLCICMMQVSQRMPVLDASKDYYLIFEHQVEAVVIDKEQAL